MSRLSSNATQLTSPYHAATIIHMARLPFDPDRINPPRPDRAPAGNSGGGRPLSVSQLAGLIKTALADGLPSKVRVVGEVSNLSDRAHWFFSLKDEAAALRCVCFATTVQKIKFAIKDGMQVVVTGRVDFYDAQGHVQLYVDHIEPVGQGLLELQLRQLIEQLRALGYFAAETKKPLPLLPRRVAVVTSRSAAALQDVISTARRRWAGCQLLLVDVRVQGAAAAPEVAAAIRALSRHGARLGLDAIILTRGGGSIEDLWAFNERLVADAIHACSLPIVAAIGHETDITIAELVADVRCATPTQAALTLIPDHRTLEHQLHQFAQRLSLFLRRRLEHDRHRLTSAARHPLFRRPHRLIDAARQNLSHHARRLLAALPRRLYTPTRQLDSLQRELPAALLRRLQSAKLTLDAHARHLQSVSPQGVLKRGYSYTLGPDGRVLRRAADVSSGDLLTTVLAEGQLRSRVEPSPTSPATPAKPTPRPRPARHDDSAPSLFDAPQQNADAPADDQR